ncbi:MAG: hypothetical protein PHU53_01300 [Thermoplasmata archaeon]|nr:hypothetical protein [Thermoplasmata archaeon]
MTFGRMMGLAEPLTSREGKLTLLALIMMLYVIALFLSVAIHEIFGHMLFTTLLGGDAYAVYLSPGNGYVSFWLPPELTAAEGALIYMSGILVQLLIGTLVLLLVLPRIKNFVLGLFTLMFCIGMTVHSSMYLFMGYIYSTGDTRYAVAMLGISPDAFLVAGIILAGIFTIYISMAGLKFLGRYMDLEEDRERSAALFIFWFPPLLLGGIISFIVSLGLPRNEIAYPILNSAILILFLGVALMLVPMFSEPKKETEHRLSIKSILAVVVCFLVVMAGWAGIFGLSQSTAHGLLLHDPPVQVEHFYMDSSIGNVALTVFANGTVRTEITLRNLMESPSPLEERIYRTFNTRPNWDRYIARSQSLISTMFGIPRETAENLTFSTELSPIRSADYSDELGRKCMTYISIADIGTRQAHMTYDDIIAIQEIEPVTGDYILEIADPWMGQSGYLDEVRVSWNESLANLEILAWNDGLPSIAYNFGNTTVRSVGWSNANISTSPTTYRFVFGIIED